MEMSQSLAAFGLDGKFWDQLKGCETPPEYTPELFLTRRKIADGYRIDLARYAGTMIIYVESIAKDARLKFRHGIVKLGLKPEDLEGESTRLYIKQSNGDATAVLNKTYDLLVGDRILVSDATFELYCDHPDGAVVLLAGIDPGYQCGGRPCLHPGP
jgi:hypothetical protein